MLRNIYLGYALIVTCVFGWQTWHGHQAGNDEAERWNRQGSTQYHK